MSKRHQHDFRLATRLRIGHPREAMEAIERQQKGVKYEPPVPSAPVILEEGINPMPPKKWWQFWRKKDV